jgi:PhnB protein
LEAGPARRSVAPLLSVRRGLDALAFYRDAFGATVAFQIGGTPDNESVVAQLAVGDASFWVADESPEHENFSPESLGGSTARLILIVDDPHAVQARALAVGAREIVPVDERYGWLLGRVADPFGHHWEIGHPLGEWPPPTT